MPVLPRTLIYLRADLLTTLMRQRLRRTRNAAKAQRRIWKGLVEKLAKTAYGRTVGIEAKMTYATFHDRVPLQTSEQIAPFIEKMKRGEADQLWPGKCSLYVQTPGTVDGRPKLLPVTEEMLVHFRQAASESLYYYTARIGNAGVFRGRHLFLGGSVPLTRLPEAESSFVAYSADLSGITTINLPGWAEKHLHEPGAQIAQMPDWSAKLDAIVERTWNRDLTLIAGAPNWIVALGEQLRTRIDAGDRRLNRLQELWPNLECIVHGGMPAAPFADELRAITGPTVKFHEVYPASEGFIAAQDADRALGLRVMSEAGLFFEFLPLSEYNESFLPTLGAKTVPLESVKTGVSYVIVMTTPAGLCRYVLGDVVRFVSTEPPRLMYVGRTKLQLSAFAEHVTEQELTEALLAVCRRHGWNIVNFHVAPVLANKFAGNARGRHEWWIELRSGTNETPTGPIMSPELDLELRRLNPQYDSQRAENLLDAPIVRLVMPGVFEHWMRRKGQWGGQHKTPRCRSDREIADELTELTKFATDSFPPATNTRAS